MLLSQAIAALDGNFLNFVETKGFIFQKDRYEA